MLADRDLDAGHDLPTSASGTVTLSAARSTICRAARAPLAMAACASVPWVPTQSPATYSPSTPGTSGRAGRGGPPRWRALRRGSRPIPGGSARGSPRPASRPAPGRAATRARRACPRERDHRAAGTLRPARPPHRAARSGCGPTGRTGTAACRRRVPTTGPMVAEASATSRQAIRPGIAAFRPARGACSQQSRDRPGRPPHPGPRSRGPRRSLRAVGHRGW
jgi:hypothetical protein